jgi:hypothetical protein
VAIQAFFTPPKLEPLNLDLASLSGGGWAPSQFYGELHDGRTVYGRYRGAWLEVYISNTTGGDAYLEDNCVLTARIGPPFHGGLSLGQFCRYVGITIAGALPPMPSDSQIADDCLLDLSGQTTFMDFFVTSTAGTAFRLYDEIVTRIPDVIGAQQIDHAQGGYSIRRSASEASSYRLVFFRTPSQAAFRGDWPVKLVDIEDDKRRLSFGLIQHGAFRPPFKPIGSAVSEALKADVGSPVILVESEKNFLVDHLHLRLWFPTDDARTRALTEQIHQIACSCYPLVQVDGFDLTSGARRPDLHHEWHLDPEVMKWIGGSSERWLTAYQEPGTAPPKYIGWRPRFEL